MKHLRWIVALGLLGTLLPAARAEDETLMSVAKGDRIPLTIAPAELPDDALAFKVVTVGQDPEGTGGLVGMGMFMAMSAMDGGANTMFTLMEMNNILWTQGKALTMGGEEYLIGYHLDTGASPIMPAATAGAQKPHWVLRLDLVRKSAIAFIGPRPDLKKADLQAVIADLDKAAERSGRSTAPAPSEAEAKPQTISNAKQIALGVIMYAGDYDDFLPYAQGTKAVCEVSYPYVKSIECFKTYNPQGGMLAFNMALAGVNISDIPKPAEVPLFYDSVAWPDGSRVVAFADGHAKSVSAEEWTTLSAKLKLKLKRHGKPLPADLGKDFGQAAESS